MSQTLMGYSAGFAAAAFVAIYLALRRWAAYRRQAVKPGPKPWPVSERPDSNH